MAEEVQKTFAGTDTIVVPAKKEEFEKIRLWMTNIFDQLDIQGKPRKQLFIVADEIFTNISSYAYCDKEEGGDASLTLKYLPEEKAVTLIFSDTGIQYNPLTQEPPDIVKRIQELTVGGLGIFMVRKMVTAIDYEYKDSHNILTLKKLIA